MAITLDPRHLVLLRELSARGSITAVAAATHRTPSAISQQLRAASLDVGTALVERKGRGIQLTEAGQLMAEAAIEVDIALERARTRVEALMHSPMGVVQIAALPSAAEYLLAPTIVELSNESIDVVLQDEDVDERSFAELARDNDIVIGHSMVSSIPTGAENLSCAVICREPVDIAMPDTHRLANSATICPQDLIGESWISVPIGFPFHTVLQTIEQVTDSSATIVQRVRDNRVVESLVVAGLGIALLPRFTTRQRDGLVLRPLVDIAAQRWVVAMSRQDRAERAVVRRVLDVLHDVGAHIACDTTH
ncbi:LysR family transcriptional regulator [Granulosicoccus antarcticus]|uniref:HTH-type transcriptional regulator GltC n=1 Tax=Granulosicoccus antarcticus IMCC3135 TaxID=1192854 RepID=A0A2Z2NWM1_9GAMM|nr:LysR family transcriptional regulator [Granulosicoccus antarcticus]ASJ75832.1 HTH-type transcriptional regulator GltC [Granulosicoccus antarcticus IMCC3135]